MTRLTCYVRCSVDFTSEQLMQNVTSGCPVKHSFNSLDICGVFPETRVLVNLLDKFALIYVMVWFFILKLFPSVKFSLHKDYKITT